jgi:hypothetical protein
MVTNKTRTSEPFARVLRAYELCLGVGPEQVISRTQ